MCAVEFFTEEKPWKDRALEIDVIMAILRGSHHPRPSEVATDRGLSDKMWSLMLSCWLEEPTQRPDMQNVSSSLSQTRTLANERVSSRECVVKDES